MKFKIIVGSLFLGVALLAAPLEVTYTPPSSQNDERYTHNLALLNAALEATQERDGPFVLTPSDYVNQNRNLSFALVKNGRMSLTWSAADEAWEKELRPIRYPVFKGLLGYRVFLIRKERQKQFSEIKSIEELKKLKLCTGAGWGVTKLYQHHGFSLLVEHEYETLFKLLNDGFCDYFSRGIHEAPQELLDRAAKFPNVVIEEELALYHPLPFYMYVQRSPAGEELAKRIESGMEKIIANGVAEQLFKKHLEGYLKMVDFSKRRLLKLDNPMLSPQTPLERKELWLDPTKR